MTDIKEFTNRELGIILEDIQRDIKRINHYIEGNGKKGLLDRMNDVEKCTENHTTAIFEIVSSKKALHSRVLDVVWKIGTTIVLVFLGLDKYR